MSRDSNHKIAIYENLPSGGAKQLYLYNLEMLSQFKTKKFTENYLPRNLLSYLIYILFILPREHYAIRDSVNSYELAIFYHTWFTKSPFLLRLTNIPKIYLCHEPPREFYDPEHIKLQNYKERIVNLLRLPVKWVDKKNVQKSGAIIIVNSKYSKRVVDNAYGIKSRVIYPGIDTMFFQRKEKKKNQVISVGAINKLKRFHFLIDVIARTNLSSRPKLVLVGNGANKAYMKELVSYARQKKVKMKIKLNISNNEVAVEYARSKMFLYAPVNEPFGIVVLEAMAAGLPICVYTKGGGYNEIVSSKNGLINNNLNSDKWSKKIDKLFSSKKDLRKYGEFNRKYVKKYDKKIMNKKLLEIILKEIKNNLTTSH